MTLEVSVVNTGVAAAAGGRPTLLCGRAWSSPPRRICWTFGEAFGLLSIGEARSRRARKLTSVDTGSDRFSLGARRPTEKQTVGLLIFAYELGPLQQQNLFDLRESLVY